MITGGGQGLGAATARRLAADGLHVTVADLDGARAEAVAADVDGVAVELDVTDAEAVDQLAATLDGLDVLVNNAGIWQKFSLEDSTHHQLRSVIEVNVLGVLNCTKALSAKLAAGTDPCIVNLSSGAAATHSPNLGSYPASKAAVESLTRQWAVELAPIRVNAVGPGMIVTEGTAENYEGRAGELRAMAVPAGRVGAPDDVADVIGFLVGTDARYVSGQIIYVDGGLSAGSPGR